MSLTTLPAGWASVAPEWSALLARAVPPAGAFATPQFQSAWWDAFAAGPECRIDLHAVRDGGELIGVLPLMRHDAGLGLIGDPDVCDYMDIVASPGREADVAGALLDHLDAAGAASLSLPGLPHGSGTLTLLPPAAAARGWDVRSEPEAVCPVLQLAPDWDGYLAGIKTRHRREVRRKMRNLLDGGATVALEAIDEPEALIAALPEFLALMAGSRADKAGFLTPRMADFFRRLAAAMAPAGLLRLYFFHVDGKRRRGGALLPRRRRTADVQQRLRPRLPRALRGPRLQGLSSCGTPSSAGWRGSTSCAARSPTSSSSARSPPRSPASCCSATPPTRGPPDVAPPAAPRLPQHPFLAAGRARHDQGRRHERLHRRPSPGGSAAPAAASTSSPAATTPPCPPSCPIDRNVRVVNISAGPPASLPPLDVYAVEAEFRAGVQAFVAQDAEPAGHGAPYDLIHSHYWVSAITGMALADDWRRPHVAMFHTLGEVKNRARRAEREPALRIDAERGIVARADRVICATPHEKSFLVADLRRPRRLRQRRAGRRRRRPLPPRRSPPRPRRRPAARWASPPSPRPSSSAGWSGSRASTSSSARPPWPTSSRPCTSSSSAATRPTPPSGRDCARSRSPRATGDRIHFVDAVDRDTLAQYYRAADVCVVPSYYESFGLVAVEALACGTPVIATRVGGLQYTVRDGQDRAPDLVALPRALRRAAGGAARQRRPARPLRRCRPRLGAPVRLGRRRRPDRRCVRGPARAARDGRRLVPRLLIPPPPRPRRR